MKGRGEECRERREEWRAGREKNRGKGREECRRRMEGEGEMNGVREWRKREIV